jgi:2-C-methyl-D-erythritol 4-phosphate cytidylyltransferase
VVHDGARPLLTLETLAGALQSARGKSGLVVAVPVRDTIKVVDELGQIRETPRRETLWAAQTPQVFPAGILREAYQRALEDRFAGTDDASLVERLGYSVEVFPGSGENLKITAPEDLLLAEAILQRRGGIVLRHRV